MNFHSCYRLKSPFLFVVFVVFVVSLPVSTKLENHYFPSVHAAVRGGHRRLELFIGTWVRLRWIFHLWFYIVLSNYTILFSDFVESRSCFLSDCSSVLWWSLMVHFGSRFFLFFWWLFKAFGLTQRSFRDDVPCFLCLKQSQGDLEGKLNLYVREQDRSSTAAM